MVGSKTKSSSSSDFSMFLLQLKSAAELKTEHDSGAVPEKEYFTRLQKLIVPKVS